MDINMSRGVGSGFAGKKYLIIASIVFLAAACSKQSTQPQSGPVQNPPTTLQPTDDWQSYTSAQNDFVIKYPNNFSVSTDINKVRPLTYIPVCDDTMVSCVYYSGSEYKGTNFDGAGVSVNILSDLNTEGECYKFNVPTNEAQTSVGDITINAVTFKSAIGGGAATGHYDKVQVYRNFRSNKCYEIAQTLASTSIGVYEPGAIKAFNEDKVWNELADIVKTFEFVK